VIEWQGQLLQALITRAAAEDLALAPGNDAYASIKAVAVEVVPQKARASTVTSMGRPGPGTQSLDGRPA
jgi:hypothetical protein